MHPVTDILEDLVYLLNEDIFTLYGRLFAADDTYFQIIPAPGTVYVQGNDLIHHPLYHSRYHRGNGIQTLVKHVKVSFDLLHVQRLTFCDCRLIPLSGQYRTFSTFC